MRRLLFMVAVAVLTAFNAETAHASTVDQLGFSGDYAVAFFSSESGCVATYTDVLAGAGRMRSSTGWEAYAGLGVNVSQYDNCRGRFITSATGSTPLARDAFQVGPKDTHLVAVVTLYEFFSGTFIPVAVDVTWTPTGPSYKSKMHRVFESPGFKNVLRESGITTPASAAGTVATPDGTNFVPNSTIAAQIGSNSTGTLTISRKT
jgi:hypothetical protein